MYCIYCRISLHAEVACMCQLGSDFSQGTSKGSAYNCAHVLICHRFLIRKEIKENPPTDQRSSMRSCCETEKK